MGGYHPTILPHQTLQDENVDIVVRGYGERTFYELVKDLERGEELRNIAGLSYKDKDAGEIFENPDRSIEDINNFPPLPYNLIDIEKYLTTEFGQRTAQYVSSRGCPFNCGFCADSKVYKRKWNALRIERVLDDLQKLYERYNIDSIRFYDSNFFVSESRVVAFCKGLLERKIRIKWGKCNGRTDTLLKYKDTTWELMKESGCTSILVGAESGFQQALDLIDKHNSVEETLEIQRKCKVYNIQVAYSFMIGFPWPRTDNKNLFRKEYDATMKLIKKLSLSLSPGDYFLLFKYTPYPGAKLYNLCLQRGWQNCSLFAEWGKVNLWDIKPAWLSNRDINLIHQFSTYYLPFLTGKFLRRAKQNMGFLSPFFAIIKVVHAILLKLIYLRIDKNFYLFSLEYYSARIIKRLANKLGLFHLS